FENSRQTPLALIHMTIVEQTNAKGFRAEINGSIHHVCTNIELLPIPIFTLILLIPEKINPDIPCSITLEYNVVYGDYSTNHVDPFIFCMDGVPFRYSYEGMVQL